MTACPRGHSPELRLKGRGIQKLRGSGKGDLFVKVEVEVPKHLTPLQKDLLMDFEKAMGGNTEILGGAKRTSLRNKKTAVRRTTSRCFSYGKGESERSFA